MAIWLEERNPRTRERTVGCHYGNEALLQPSDDGRLGIDRWSVRPTHEVDVPYDANLADLGWGRRGGRLPICPEHRHPTDEDLSH